jgi:cysteine-rich repeat protein
MTRLWFGVPLLLCLSCSFLFLSTNRQCADEPDRCQGTVSIVCRNQKIFQLDCGARGCDEDTGECTQFCGDGFVQPGEECEPALDRRCTVDCTFCGNNDLDDGEQCDDANIEDLDGCDRLCQNEPPLSQTCSDGVIQPGESCYRSQLLPGQLNAPLIEIFDTQLADMDLDGAHDVIQARRNEGETVFAIFLLRQTDSGFGAPIRIGVIDQEPISIIPAQLGDIDGGEDLLDLLILSRNAASALFIGDDLRGSPAQIGFSDNFTSAVVGEFGGGQHRDIVIGALANPRLSLFLATPDAGVWTPLPLNFPGDAPNLSVAEVDGQAPQDLFIQSADSLISLSQLGGELVNVQTVLGTAPLARPLIADFNGDDRLDALAALGLGFLELYLGIAPGVMNDSGIGIVLSASAVPSHAVDLDLDGDLDLVTELLEDGSDDLALFSNDGDNNFSLTTTFQKKLETKLLFVGDINGDNLPDLALFERELSAIRYLLSDF